MTHLRANEADVATDSVRWARVGRSLDADSFRAGMTAARNATGGDTASLYIVFAGHRHDHEPLLAGVTSVASPHAVVVGCTTGGEISTGGPTDDGVVVMALGGSGISVSARSAEIVGGDLRSAGEQVADATWDVEERGHTVLLLLSDGLAGDQQELLRGAYATVGTAIPLVGGCAADGMEMSHTALFHATSSETRIGGGQVIGVAISSTRPIGIGMFHGWQPVGEPVVITKSIGNVVFTIDEEPALDRYLRLHGADDDLADDPEAFAEFAATHPISVSRGRGPEVRRVASADPVARSITTSASIPQGVTVQTMVGTADTTLDATDVACREALDQLGGPPVAVLAFDCVARRSVMGDDVIVDEVARMEHQVGAPVAGFYSYGEFARVGGASGLHNQTLVTLAIG